MARSPGRSANGFRETAAVLALLAIVANLFAGLTPLPRALGLMTPELAALCRPADAPGGGEPGLPGPHHDDLCCFTHQLAGAAPSAGTFARPVFVAADTPVVADQPAAAARPHADQRPRAPPLAA